MSVAKLSPDQIRRMIADVKARHSAPKWPSIVPSDAQNSYLAEPAWPVIHEAAYYGLAGEIVRSIEPHSEADPVAILLQFLAAFGNAVGISPHYQVEGDKHRGKAVHRHVRRDLQGTTRQSRRPILTSVSSVMSQTMSYAPS
jgi:hypothetical protein